MGVLSQALLPTCRTWRMRNGLTLGDKPGRGSEVPITTAGNQKLQP